MILMPTAGAVQHTATPHVLKNIYLRPRESPPASPYCSLAPRRLYLDSTFLAAAPPEPTSSSLNPITCLVRPSPHLQLPQPKPRGRYLRLTSPPPPCADRHGQAHKFYASPNMYAHAFIAVSHDTRHKKQYIFGE